MSVMFWLKPVFAGMATVIGACVLAPSIVLPIGSFFVETRHPDEVIGWDPVSWARQSIIPWMILLAAFGAGFYWQYRRQLK
jgi:hypothetical protein